MPEIPDLSKLKNGQQPLEPEQPADVPTARGAFLVVIRADGNIEVSTNLNQEIMVERVVTTDDIYMACTLISRDITVQQTAALVSQGLLQMGSMMQQQAQHQAIANRLNLK